MRHFWLGTAFAFALGTGCVSEKSMARAASRTDLATAYLNEKNPEAAVAAAREASKLDPRNWRARSVLAMAYIVKGQPEMAEESFLAALKINPDEGEILVNYGAFLVQQARPLEAIPLFERAIGDLDYRNPATVLSNLSRALLDAGQPDQAVVRAEEALRRSPNLCPALYHLGLAQEARNQPELALSAYDKLTETCPAEAVGGWLRSGCIRAGLGDRPGAAADLGQVESLAPGTQAAIEARSCQALAGE